MGRKVRVVTLGLAGFVLLLVPTVGSAASSDVQDFRLSDRCEPRSFNKAVGSEVCTGDGDETFKEFIAEVAEEKEHDDWSLDPDEVTVDEGTRLRVTNEGGELHTFTRVQKFGGGFVPELNELSGNPVPRPRCAKMNPDGTLAPRAPNATNIFIAGGDRASLRTGDGTRVPSGINRFQCCLHPWMRTTVTVGN